MEYRKLNLELERTETKNNSVIATLSTETPVNRGYYNEILIHGSENIDLSRGDFLPVIEQHDSEKLNEGIVENIHITNKKLKGYLRFGSSDRARTLHEDVKSGIVKNLSIGYQINEYEEDAAGNNRYITRWQPLEISLVSVPADPDAVIGRSENNKKKGYKVNTQNILEEKQNKIESLERELAEALEQPIKKTKTDNAYIEDYRTFDKDYGKPQTLECGVTLGEQRRNNDTNFLKAVMSAGVPGGYVDTNILTRAASGQNEGINSEGGFLLSPTFEKDVLSIAFTQNDLLKRCRVIKTSNPTVKIPALDQGSRTDGNRFCRAYYKGEAALLSSSTGKFKELELNLKKLSILTYSSEELMQDYSLLTNVLKVEMGKEINFKIEDGIINGTGAGQPLGIANSSGLIAVTKETGQTASTLTIENVYNMMDRLLPSSFKNSVWVIHPTVLKQLYQLQIAIGTGGNALFVTNAADKAPGTLMGLPVIISECCQTLGTQGDIYLVDLSNHVAIQHEVGINMVSSAHIRFLYDEVAFKTSFRWDAQPLLSAAITPYKGSTTLSTMVALQDRS